MLYTDDAEVVSQSPEQLREMMGVIVAVCAAATTTVSEAKTEIMCLRMKRMPAFTTHSEQMQLARCRTKRTSLYTSRGMSTTISTCPSMSSGV